MAWTLLDVVAARFEVTPEVSIWYPPSALDMALLLLFGLRYWPALLLNTPIHFMVVSKGAALGWASLLAFDAVTTAGYAGAAWLLARVLRIDPGLRDRRDLVWFVGVAVFAAPLLVAAGQVLNLALAGRISLDDAPLNTLLYFAGDATGIAMLAPPLLVLGRRYASTLAFRPRERRQPGPQAPGPAKPVLPSLLVAEVAGLGLAVWASYGWDRPISLDYSYIIWLPLLWVALRYGFDRTVAFVLVANMAVVALVAARFQGVSPFALQFGLLAFTVATLLVSATATAMHRAAERLRYQATHDDLTGLPNRGLFRATVAEALYAQPDPAPVVAILDLDAFRDVNNTLGHPTGDLLLQGVGARLQELAGPGSTVARFGGDEFGLLLHGRLDPDAALGAIMAGLAEGVVLDGVRHALSASAGASVPPRDGSDGGDDADQLIQHADLALYRAKDAGPAQRMFFARSMAVQLTTRLETGRELRLALERGEFVLAFQPQFTCPDRRLTGAEALVRWAHPARGLLAPHEFLPYAEAAGLTAAVGAWVLEEACRQAAGWGGALSVSVNVAPAQWRGGADLAAQVGHALAAAGLDATRLTLEITEEALLRAEEAQSAAALGRLRRSGVRVSMDDFGTGHSSLSRLRRLPVDELKIDRSFVMGIGRNRDDEAITRTVVALARALDQRAVAEGVETEAQFSFLAALGCDRAQGYLLSRPLDAEAFKAFASGQQGALIAPRPIP